MVQQAIALMMFPVKYHTYYIRFLHFPRKVFNSCKSCASSMDMKKSIMAAVGMAAILAAAALALTTSQAAFAANINIDIVQDAQGKGNQAYSQSTSEIHTGDVVTWTNKDSTAHTATSGTDGKPDGRFGVKSDGTPELIMPNGVQEFKPTAAGDYSYFCYLHPAMVGKLTVEPAGVS
jgi:plastocyanin